MGDSLRDALEHVPSDHILDEFLGKHGVKVQPREFGALLGSLRVAMEAEAVADGALADRPANAQPVASRERVAEGPEELRELADYCEQQAEGPVVNDLGEGKLIAYADIADRLKALLAAGVFREPQPVSREALAKALHDAACGCDHYGHMVEIDDRDAADVVLALIGGDAK